MSHAPTPGAELLSLSQSMLSAVEEGDWGKVAEIEPRRQKVLAMVKDQIASRQSDASIEIIAGQMREVLSLNKRMIAIGEKSKAGLLESMSGLAQGRKAVKAYYGE